MEVTLQKVSATVIIAGAIFFLAAAFSPISRVFGEGSPERKLEMILAAQQAWTVAQILFVVGAVVSVVGIGMAAYYFRNDASSLLLYLSVVALFTGAVLWGWHVYLRALDPSAFTAGAIPIGLFIGYTLLTQAGLAIFGVALLHTELHAWVGWMFIGSMVLFFLLTVVFGDMPPFVYYVITLIAGIALYRAEFSMIPEL